MTADDFVLRSASDRVHVLNLTPQNVVTTLTVETVKRDANGVVDVKGTDLVKIAIVERHQGTGNISLGLVNHYGLKGGAIAQTVAHDSHNIVVMGDSDADMALACNTLKAVGGGLVVVKGGKVLGTMPLEIGGLMTDLSKEELRARFNEMLGYAYQLEISREVEPFMTMSFLCLPVIPQIRITDKGIFDVFKFNFIPLEAE